MKNSTASWKICVVTLVLCGLACSAGAQNANGGMPMKELRMLLKDENIAPQQVSEWLATAGEDDRAKLQELVRGNPEEAKSFIRQKLDERQEQRQAGQKAIFQAAQAVRQCKNDADKPALEARLRELLTADFKRLSDELAVRIRMQEQNLDSARQDYKQRLDNAEKMISERMEKMLAPKPGDGAKPNKNQLKGENKGQNKGGKGPNKGQNKGGAKGPGGKQQKQAAPAMPAAEDEVAE